MCSDRTTELIVTARAVDTNIMTVCQVENQKYDRSEAQSGAFQGESGLTNTERIVIAYPFQPDCQAAGEHKAVSPIVLDIPAGIHLTADDAKQIAAFLDIAAANGIEITLRTQASINIAVLHILGVLSRFSNWKGTPRVESRSSVKALFPLRMRRARPRYSFGSAWVTKVR